MPTTSFRADSAYPNAHIGRPTPDPGQCRTVSRRTGSEQELSPTAPARPLTGLLPPSRPCRGSLWRTRVSGPRSTSSARAPVNPRPHPVDEIRAHQSPPHAATRQDAAPRTAYVSSRRSRPTPRPAGCSAEPHVPSVSRCPRRRQPTASSPPSPTRRSHAAPHPRSRPGGRATGVCSAVSARSYT